MNKYILVDQKIEPDYCFTRKFLDNTSISSKGKKVYMAMAFFCENAIGKIAMTPETIQHYSGGTLEETREGIKELLQLNLIKKID